MRWATLPPEGMVEQAARLVEASRLEWVRLGGSLWGPCCPRADEHLHRLRRQAGHGGDLHRPVGVP
ncbi:hypothetical protein [Nocardiopsis alba]|uniref:hypothetical protein n=1 Tax=Nocardiopsis alba TaxID=53437 RepID=UPI0033F97A75